MNRKKATELWPIIKAFSEGRAMQVKDNNVWKDVDDNHNCVFLPEEYEYRIKPEPKYRPFKSQEECLQEMLKHQPLGVVKDKHFANYQTHRAFTFLTNEGCNFRGYEDMTFETSFKNLLFADGTPFGVKVEE